MQGKYLAKIKIEDAQKFNKKLKQEILYILDLMPEGNKISDYPEDLFDQRADEQGYLKDIYYVEIAGIPKEQYI